MLIFTSSFCRKAVITVQGGPLGFRTSTCTVHGDEWKRSRFPHLPLCSSHSFLASLCARATHKKEEEKVFFFPPRLVPFSSGERRGGKRERQEEDLSPSSPAFDRYLQFLPERGAGRRRRAEERGNSIICPQKRGRAESRRKRKEMELTFLSPPTSPATNGGGPFSPPLTSRAPDCHRGVVLDGLWGLLILSPDPDADPPVDGGGGGDAGGGQVGGPAGAGRHRGAALAPPVQSTYIQFQVGKSRL